MISLRSFRDPILVMLSLVAIWQVLHQLAGDSALTAPAPTLAHLWEMVWQPRFLPHLRETALAFAQALLIACVGGVTIGVLLGGHRLSGEVAEPLLVGLYSIPKITLYPVILLLFGLGMPAKVAFGALHGIIPVVLFTMNAVRNINRTYLRAGRAMRLSPSQTGWFVLVPATLPEIFSRPAHRLFAHPARHDAGRAVRVRARPRLPADDGDRPARCEDYPGHRHLHLDLRCHPEQCDAGDRSPPAPAHRPRSRQSDMNKVTIYRDLGSPLHHQIYLVLADGIATGRYASGEPLPTEEQLTEIFSVSRITVRRAMTSLQNDGLIERGAGRRTIVRPQIGQPLRVPATSVIENIAAYGAETVATVLEFDYVPAPGFYATGCRTPGTVRCSGRCACGAKTPILSCT